MNEWPSTGPQEKVLHGPPWQSLGAPPVERTSRPVNAAGGVATSNISQPDHWLSFGFAFVGGYGDAAGFILAKTFTGHVTGNLVLAAIAVVAHDWRAAFAHVSAVTCFLAGIPLSVLIARWLAVRELLTTVVGIEVILIVAAYLAATSHSAARVEILVICMSLALGLQNGVFRRTGGISVHTNYLSGMLTGLIAGEAEKLSPQVAPGRATVSDPKSALLFGIWVAFVLGAVTAAAAVVNFKEPAILGAALILLAIIIRNSILVLQLRAANRKEA